MTNLASSEPVRLTPAQRDALIDLAARLQAEHAGTVGADELARAAAEAGIEPRFLGEAAARFGTAPRAIGVAEPVLAVLGIALFDGLFFGIVSRSWFFPLVGALRLPLLLAAGFAFASVFVRHRPLRWIAPLAPLAVWTALGIVGTIVFRLHHHGEWRTVAGVAAAFGAVQALAVAAAAGWAAMREGLRWP